MSIEKYLATGRLEITKYSRRSSLAKDNVPFTGVPRKHPYDAQKLLLIVDPFSTHAVFYEFRLRDVSQVDEMPNLVNESGESAQMARVWVKKAAWALRYEPFRVEDTAGYLRRMGGAAE